MPNVSLLRLNLLRATYLLIAVAMGAQTWPLIFRHPVDAEMQWTVARSMLGALTILCAGIGIRRPLAMLPLLLWELAWKSIWVLFFGLPQWRAGYLTASATETMIACVMGMILFPLVTPWRYAWYEYAKKPGRPWRVRTAAPTP